MKESQSLLRPYWDIADKIWSRYPPELKRINKEIEIIDRTDRRRADMMLYRYPQIVFIKKQILLQQKMLKLTSPQIANALAIYY